MCVTPCRLPDGTEVACRYCWQCRKNRINDLVGRCIAEQYSATATRAVTLTYSDDLLAERNKAHIAVLVYRDFQAFMKRLRKAGYNVRYIVAGEYGSKSGRAHWHAVLFFDGKAPECIHPSEMAQSLLDNTENLAAPRFTDKICEEARFYWKPWPHGVVYFEKPEYGGFAYIMKYALKDQKDRAAVGHLAMSKKPPLGHSYFMDLAERLVQQGLSPQHASYQFRDHFDSKGKRRKFWLQGRMRELFLERYLARWRDVHGTPPPPSEYVEEQEDKWIREQAEARFDLDEWLDRLAGKARYDTVTAFWRRAENFHCPESRAIVGRLADDTFVVGWHKPKPEEWTTWQGKSLEAVNRILKGLGRQGPPLRPGDVPLRKGV